MNLLALAEEQFDQTVSDRRFLHQHPELSNEEIQTAAFLKQKLEDADFLVESGIAGHGLIARCETGREGPVMMLRFDMDALPVQEENDCSYRSRNEGKMHACGHDGHMAIGLTIARLIQSQKKQLRGTFLLLFQPAEEAATGALAVVRSGAIQHAKPDYIVSAHLWNEKPLGWLGIKAGPLMAGSSLLEIEINGKGGHGGRPQLATDPIVAAAQLVCQLQTIVSRNLSPLDSAVVSVCSIQVGNAYNIIPSRVRLLGTIRHFDPAVRAKIGERINEICQGVALASGCEIRLDLKTLLNPTVNDPSVARAMRSAAAKLNLELDIDEQYQTMLSEDIGVLLEQVPGCFVLVGAGQASDGNQYGHHHPRFDFEENARPLAAALLLQTCLDLGGEALNG